MTEPPSRPTIEVAAPVGGWPHPWPNVAELVAVLPAQQWTLVGGLMTQLHSIHHGLGVVRPTNDVDIVLHIETRRGVPTAAATALEQIGYRLQSAVDPRNNTAHRFVRGQSRVDLVAGDAEEVVDVLMADHPAPMVVELLRGQEMVRIEGGTQALRRTVNARLEIEHGTVTTISVPRPFGALILKGGRVQVRLPRPRPSSLRRRSPARLHRRPLPRARRLHRLRPIPARDLAAGITRRAPAWRALPDGARGDAQAALRLLCDVN